MNTFLIGSGVINVHILNEKMSQVNIRCPVDCGDTRCLASSGGGITRGSCRCSDEDLKKALEWWRNRACWLEAVLDKWTWED